jgi:hypothetical protein
MKRPSITNAYPLFIYDTPNILIWTFLQESVFLCTICRMQLSHNAGRWHQRKRNLYAAPIISDCLVDDAAERCASLQVLDQVLHATKVTAQPRLLILLGTSEIALAL